MIPLRFRPWALAVLVLTALAFLVTEVDARAGRGGSFGSRGARTFSAPPTTKTAPTKAAPIQRTITQPGPTATKGAAAAPSGARAGILNRPGLLGGVIAGFLGAGLIGLLLGHGFAGGLAGLASLFGLLLQVGLVALAAWLIWNWWQRRNAPAFAGAGGAGPSAYAQQPGPAAGPTQTAMTGLGGGYTAAGATGYQDEVTIEPADYDAFEQLLGEIQVAYGKEDLAALRLRVTPEMLSYFSEDFSDNASQGVTNQVSDVKLLSGDLAEAWREGAVDYATVAMTFSLVEQTIDRKSGRVVDGDTTPVEITELWTFRRNNGGQWLLSAIQQTEDDE